MMKPMTAALCVLALTSTLAFAQNSQPQGGANSPAASNNNKEKSTIGTSGSMQKDGMKKDPMAKGGEAKDGDGMNKGGMSK